MQPTIGAHRFSSATDSPAPLAADRETVSWTIEKPILDMANPKVAFDEAGNTGQNLLDPSQPIFVLSSVSLSDSDAAAIRDLVGRSGELHFKKLRKGRIWKPSIP